MARIFHLALASEWAEAQVTGSYTTSTLGRTLAEEGFIHASRADQWTAVRDRYYSEVTEPLLLLQIDTDLLDVPVVEEAPAPGVTETFPHIYGRLPVGAVVRALPLPPPAGPAAPAEQAVTRPRPGPDESFSRTYFREMAVNVALLCAVLALGLVGAGLGHLVAPDGGTGIGGLAGMALGVVAATWWYRRRHAPH